MPPRNIDLPPIRPTCQDNCPPQCDSVFDRVHVSYLIRSGTRVLWDVATEFTDPLPWTFQLQVGKTGNPAADDWENVGLPQVNSFYAIDGTQRVYGRTNFTHYRVKLTTAVDSYYSQPTNIMGVLSRRDWRLACETIRQERVRNRLVAQDGYLLKRRHSGLKCVTCSEYQTEETLDPSCPDCFGTGFQCGYYYPMSCVWADFKPKTTYTHLDPARGTVNDVVASARMLMLPLLDSLDVWVARKTDERYYIHKIDSVTDYRGLPIIADVQLRPAPYTDIIYDIPIPEQIAALE